MSIAEERGTAVRAVTAGIGRTSPGSGRHRTWWVVAATTAVLVGLLCVRNRFLFTTRLYEDADMGANSILIEQARHFTLLVGNYSRDHFHHPGPAYMYVQAAGESVFWAWLHVVPTAWNGQLLSAYTLNAMFVALAVGMAYRWAGSVRSAAACFAVLAGFAAVHPAVRFDQRSWPDVTGFLVQAERTGVRACVWDHAWTFMMTGQFICTSREIADGQVYWFGTDAPRGSTVIARLRQAVVTAGPAAP